MGLKNDRWILENAIKGMITPFEPVQVTEVSGIKVISYGITSYGYDFRVAPEWKVFHNAYSTIVDPKNFDERAFINVLGDVCTIPPNSFVLCRTIERFSIPRGVLTICVGKSTYARCGLILNVTPFESSWEGYATIEISNTTPLPAKVYANEGMGQVLFFEADEECLVSYEDRKGKYQNQGARVVPARMK